MFHAIVWLMVIISVFMIIVVLVQRTKGGGLNQSFAAQTQLIGVRKSADFIEKATWTLAACMLVFSFLAVALMPSRIQTIDSGLDEVIKNSAAAQQAAPAFGAQAPAAEEAPVAAEAPAAE